jgi:apolipoprotein N-acyltransferase
VATSGPGSFIQSYFSFGYLGYLFGITELGIKLAAMAGVYGLTAILVGAVVTTLYLPGHYRYLSAGIWIGALLVTNYLPQTNYNKYQSTSRTVIVVDTTFTAKTLSTYDGQNYKAKAVREAVEAALNLNPDYVVLPEDSRYLNLVYPARTIEQSYNQFLFSNPTSSSIIIDSARTELKDGRIIQRARLFSGTDGIIYEFDKQYLVPQGEFIPYSVRVLLRLSGASKSILSLPQVGTYQPGPLKQEGIIDAKVPGILFCFESARAAGVWALMRERTRPDFIVHPISHAWFNNPEILWSQLNVILRIQSRWQQVPIISAGNMATGKTYLPNGQVIVEPPLASGDGWSLRLVKI